MRKKWKDKEGNEDETDKGRKGERREVNNSRNFDPRTKMEWEGKGKKKWRKKEMRGKGMRGKGREGNERERTRRE